MTTAPKLSPPSAPLNALRYLSDAASASPKLVQVSFSRPDNPTAYQAGDVIFSPADGGLNAPTALVFPNVADNAGGSGLIIAATLVDNANPETKLVGELHLFKAPPAAAVVDGAAFAPTLQLMQNRCTTIQFPSADAIEFGNFNEYEVPVNKTFVCAPSSQNLYGVLVARNAYVPINSEAFIIQLHIVPRGSVLF